MTEGGLPAGLQSVDVRRRREEIRAEVLARGFVRIEDLAERYGVSVMTVHRDLDALQAQGWLRKVRNGATAHPSTEHHGSMAQRSVAMADAKQQIAAAALELVDVNDALLIDESTTALALVDLLPGRAPLTVISNSLPVLNRLATASGVDLVGVGGAFYPAYQAFLGMRTVDAIRSLRATTLFMSTTAVTRGACYHQSQETVAVKRAMLESAERSVLLLDHTKFAKSGLYRLAGLTDFDVVIVDAGLPADRLAELRELGVDVRVAPAG